MAGFYPDVPGHRFAYHVDGTKIFLLNAATSILTEVTSQAATLNNEGDDYVSGEGNTSIIFVFPEARNLQGYFVAKYNSGNRNYTMGTMHVSTDTTDGLDGTWTVLVNPTSYTIASDSIVPNFRSSIATSSASNIKGVKFDYSSGYDVDGFRAIHFYGNIPLTESPDRLAFWHPTLDSQLDGAYFDWGDDVQGQSYTKKFRIKNNSSSKTANSIMLSSGTQTGSMAIDFSTDGSTYTSSLNIGNLAPGAMSGELYARRSVAADEGLNTRTCYLSAVAGNWS